MQINLFISFHFSKKWFFNPIPETDVD